MKLRSLVIYGMVVVIIALVVLAILGHTAARSLDQRLDRLATLRAVDSRLGQMVSAIDYVSLVRADWPTLKQLANDSDSLTDDLKTLDYPQARLAHDHLVEIAALGNEVRNSTDRPAALRMLADQARLHHAGAREAIAALVDENNELLLADLYRILRALAVAALTFALLVIIAALIVQRRLVRPIKAIDGGLRALRKGQMDARIHITSDDEFGDLARSFNTMADERQRHEARLAESEHRFRELTESIGEVFWIASPNKSETFYVSPAFEKLWGMPGDVLYERASAWTEAIHPDDFDQVQVLLGGHAEGRYLAEYRIVRPDGSIRWIQDKSSPVHDETGRIVRIVGVARDITNEKEYQQRLGERIKELRCLYQVLEVTTRSELTVDEAASQVVELLPKSMLHESHAVARIAVLDSVRTSMNWQDPARSISSQISVDGKAIGTIEVGYISADSRARQEFLPEEVALINGIAIHLGRMIKSRRMADTLTRSERLKAIGELTGGIAHDFNNLLTVIIGNAEMLMERDDNDVSELAGMINKAASRGAELTSRLLAFARRQALEPVALDVSGLITDISPLLKRSLGESIELNINTRKGLWIALADPAQLESALLNLCLNARDALTGSGKLTIETANAVLDADYTDDQEELVPGEFVMLAVSDNGCGIPREHLEHVFEPFYTTKPTGTGLGLSMVYGLVKQLGGHARIYSEPGQGTTVKLYLKRADQGEAGPLKARAAPDQLQGTETILVVEDNDLVRANACKQLGDQGYRVIEAGDAQQALMILRARKDIDLLFTDIIMPGGMTGKELADLALQLHPDLAVLYTSGYTENAIVHNGRLDPGVELLSKPYGTRELLERTRQILDQNRIDRP